MKKTNILATKESWSQRWSSQETNIEFVPETPFFSGLHNFFKKHLPEGENLRFLEVGCYPGTYMWYFNKYFGYKPSGIEYVEKCAEQCREIMTQKNISADVIQGDLFDYTIPNGKKPWDVVASFGFIEHFQDVKPSIEKHLDLIKPGGFLVLVIPNHAGINGSLLKIIDEEKFNIHNCMDYDDMKKAVEATGKAEIIEGGYYGHIGFWNIGLYPIVKRMGKLAYILVRTPLWIIEHIGRLIVPNSRTFSPNAALIARKL